MLQEGDNHAQVCKSEIFVYATSAKALYNANASLLINSLKRRRVEGAGRFRKLNEQKQSRRQLLSSVVESPR